MVKAFYPGLVLCNVIYPPRHQTSLFKFPSVSTGVGVHRCFRSRNIRALKSQIFIDTFLCLEA
jgi:hypothetical protein